MKHSEPKHSSWKLKALWLGLLIGLGVTIYSFSPWVQTNSASSARPLLDPELLRQYEASKDLPMRKQEDHPVTEPMKVAADGLEGKPAPDFELKDERGNLHRLSSLAEGKPLLVFFIERECPCCLGAKVYVDKMHNLYQDVLSTVGIINGDQRVAREWARVTHARFPVLQDPEMKVIQAYKAERGVYTVLISPEGKIARAYPGYGKEMLKDLNKSIADLAKIEPRKFRADTAPDVLTSGCSFPLPDTP